MKHTLSMLFWSFLKYKGFFFFKFFFIVKRDLDYQN
ncbi:hypothetical protein CFP56_036946 [Quercus suber]|uniref:Photosystem II protein I n=1 Tax=Quercus suber TaxID=58331 RepID=A0AAW0J652_QUESU